MIEITDPVQELIERRRSPDVRASMSRAGGRSTSSAQTDPLRLDMSTVKLNLSLPGPPDNLWEAPHLRGKIEIDADVDLRLMHSPAGPDVTVGESVGFESMLARAMELNLEYDLDEIDLQDSCARGDLREFGNRILDEIGIGRQWELCHALEPLVGADWDEHYCLLTAMIEGSDIRFELPIAGSATRVEVRIPKGVVFRLGLTERGWLVLKRRFGGTTARRIAGAMAYVAASGGDFSATPSTVSAGEAEGALTTGQGLAFATFAGLAVSAAQLGILTSNLGPGLARDARMSGVPLDDAPGYAAGYVFTVYHGRLPEKVEGSVGAKLRGSRKASLDIEANSQTAMRDVLESAFNGRRQVALRMDGIPVADRDIAAMARKLAGAMAASGIMKKAD